MTTETRWHRHWHIRVPKNRLGQWFFLDFLRKPRWLSVDRAKVEKSIFAWGVRSMRRGDTLYSLSLLGVLHGLTGLTLYWEDKENRDG